MAALDLQRTSISMRFNKAGMKSENADHFAKAIMKEEEALAMQEFEQTNVETELLKRVISQALESSD